MAQAGDPPEASPIVECRSVSKTYTRGGGGFFSRGDAPSVTALEDVSLSVDGGEFVGIAGPSGSGKSTLLHLVGGLDTPTGGTVVLDGTDTTACTRAERTQLRRDAVGIVFQRFHLLPSLSARANVALPLVELGVGTTRRRERAAELLERVGLGDRLDHRPGQLSGGEQQRVAIARALVTDPALVVADEPTGELDTETGEIIVSLLGDVADDRAVVVASHDHDTLAATDRIVELVDGRITDDA